jgi:hypothetical protein
VALADIVDQLRGLLELARLPEPGATKVHPLRSLVDVVTTGGEITTLHGLRPQFVSQTTAPQPGQAAGSRGAGAAIPQLLAVVATLNERRSNRSDRSADFRTLTTWLAKVNRTGIARGRGSGHRALLGDDLTIHGFSFGGGHVVDG